MRYVDYLLNKKKYQMKKLSLLAVVVMALFSCAKNEGEQEVISHGCHRSLYRRSPSFG